MLLLLHETSTGTFSRVFDMDQVRKRIFFLIITKTRYWILTLSHKQNDLNEFENGLGGGSGPNTNDHHPNRRLHLENRFPVNAGITGFVAATGDTLNIKDAYKDARFDKTVDNG